MLRSLKTAAVAALLAAAWGAQATPTTTHSYDDPICIVGAGPAGLSAAKTLEDLGKAVVIFEKQAEVGGKCQAYYEDDKFFPLGAVIFTKETYVETWKLFDVTGVPYSNHSFGQIYQFNWTDGTAWIQEDPSDDTVTALMAEYYRYVEIWSSEFEPLSVVGYKNGVPDELTVSGAAWLEANSFYYLPSLFIRAMTMYGYGDYREIPVLYLLNLFTPEILLGGMGVGQSYQADFHKLFVEYAKTIEGKIHLDTTIESIDRTSNPKITYRPSSNHGRETQPCSSVIMAFPPLVDALESAGLSLTEAESTLFSHVSKIDYFASAVRVPRLPGNTSFFSAPVSRVAPVVPEGQPVGFVPLHPGSGIASVWSHDRHALPSPAAERSRVRSLLVDTMTGYNKPDPADASAAGDQVAPGDIVAWSGDIDYFPHVRSGEALRAGFYRSLQDMQGANGTYYVSALSGFELVEFALRAGRDAGGYFE
ncbi:diapophytoene desaturase [Zalerion maritima]|uniref:Diapophytoene desaturase n=1 Tax=Zalerion maritima TaxID=339359 RepID=A0AAD5RV04_9PEZI|nr:diapophytoene desaturase [Zalerion maritima]